MERDCVSDKMKNQGDSVLPFALVRWRFGLEVANSQEHKPVNPRNYFASWLSSPVPCRPLAVRQSPVKPLATLAWQWTVPHFDDFPLCTFNLDFELPFLTTGYPRSGVFILSLSDLFHLLP